MKKPRDGSHIIYVNGACRTGDSPLSLPMQDFFCTEPGKMNYKPLADRAKYLKEDEKGVGNMCKIMEDLMKDLIEEEKAKAEYRAAVKSAQMMLSFGKLTYEEIAKASSLPLSEVQALAGEKSA